MSTTIIPADAGSIANCTDGSEPVLAWAISYDAVIEDYQVLPIGASGEILGVVAYKINGRNVIVA